MTYREFVYLVFDELKILSDDKLWEPDHVIVMLHKYRALLIKQRYSHKKMDIPRIFFQEYEVNFRLDEGFSYETLEPIPEILNLNGYTLSTFIRHYSSKNKLEIISPERIKNLIRNKWTNKIDYFAISHKGIALINSTDPTDTQGKFIFLNAIFEDPSLVFPKSENILDQLIPCEASMITEIMEMCTKELGTFDKVTGDTINNAADDNE